MNLKEHIINNLTKIGVKSGDVLYVASDCTNLIRQYKQQCYNNTPTPPHQIILIINHYL